MAPEWPVVRIEDIAEKIAMGPFGSSIKVATFVDDGIPIISGAHLNGFRVADRHFNFITVNHADKLRNANVQRGDVIFTHAGNIGQVAYIPSSSKFERYIISQRQFYLRCDRSKADPAFITYFFHGSAGRHQLLANKSQVGVPSISRPTSNLKTIEVALPSLGEQRRIARFLDLLDDSIDNLRAANTTLEAIAQALFKSWFVDFDPVHAKAEGRAPEGIDAATAALFPSEFEDSELGPVPNGWRVGALGDHIDADRGLSYKGAGLAEPGNGRPMHNLNSVLEGGGYKYAGIKYYTGAFKERHLVNAGEIIVANTEQGHEYRLIGFPAIVPASYPSALYSHHLYRLRLKATTPMTIEWLYRCLMARNVREQIVACTNGSTVNMLKVVGLQIPKFVLPPATACRAFTAVVQPMRQAIETNVDRMDTLAQLRDTLLPRLISGKLRLPEARELTEAEA